MATFTADPTLMGFVRIKDLPVRGTMTQSLTVTGSADPGDAITLTKVGGATWLTVPATCLHTIAFDVSINRANLPPEDIHRPVDRSETIRVSHAGYDDLDVVVTIKVKPGGPAKILG